MAVNKKINLDETKKRADEAGKEQINDIMSMISDLGSESSGAVQEEETVAARETVTKKTAAESSEGSVKIRTESKTSASTVKKTTSAKDSKPGYISLVIPNSLKTKWKVYSSEHGMSLTDCMKMAMKLLEDMEQKEAISVEDGFITYLS